MGFSLHEDEDASTYFRTLGGVIDGEVGSVDLQEKRLGIVFWLLSIY